ncbi:MAG: hypothetical protein JXR91_05425 [Deltaproteobacteria bacterium]|nr:hypothetical protein [Deltaproteobacteria bacterium]
MNKNLWMLLVIMLTSGMFLGCSDGGGGSNDDSDLNSDTALGTDSDSDGFNDSDTENDTGSDEPPFTGVSSCSDGTMNNNETGVDCGGSCELQDCCSNGYADIHMDETGVDCGGDCGDCGTVKTYFIANDGDDDNSGTSSDKPWQTVEKVNGTELLPGDFVLFKRGDTWREELIITSSGTSELPVTFGNYGGGDKPQILGSIRAGEGSEVAGYSNIWRSDTAVERPDNGKASSIFFGEQNGNTSWGRVLATDETPECDGIYSFLLEEYDWCWSDNSIFVYAAEDPDLRYTFVEVPQRRTAITMESHAPAQYIVIDGLELMYTTMYGYSDGWPMDYEVKGLTIQNCNIGYIGIQGGGAAMGLQIWHSDMIVRNNHIHDCGRRSISYNIYLDNGRSEHNLVFENVLFENNVLYHGFHTTGLDISCEPGSGGDTFNDTLRNFTIRNNLIYDNPDDDPQASPNDFTSMGIYLWGEAAEFTGFHIYNNILKHIKQKALILNNVKNTEVYNNTFWSMNARAGVSGTGSEYRALVNVSGGIENLSFDNNLLYGDVTSDQYYLQLVTFSGGSESGVTSMNNNLYYQEDEGQILVNTSGGSYDASEWETYKTETGFDADSPAPSDPLIKDPATYDFTPMAGSPAINKATEISGRTYDYNGALLTDTPDIGAVEYFE